jgi:DNA modification methylase
MQLFCGDCLEVMPTLPDASVDMILCDLPYGTTKCTFDVLIPLEALWGHYRRVARPGAAIVLTATQPFTSLLVMSNLKWFRYALVWDKVNRYTGALNANRMPMRRHEDVLIFASKQPTFNKQPIFKKRIGGGRTSGHGEFVGDWGRDNKRSVQPGGIEPHNPCSILEIEACTGEISGLHPTQKPIALMEYLIRTYTNEGEMVLDNTMGSGSTGVGCVNTGRDFIGIEKDAGYYEVAKRRIEEARSRARQLELAV